MKFKTINPHNVEHMVPSWLVDPFVFAKLLDDSLSRAFASDSSLRPRAWDNKLSFYAELDFNVAPSRLRICVADESGGTNFPLGTLWIAAGNVEVLLPINAMLKGSVDYRGTHCVYAHTIMTECPMTYVGVTKQRWFSRFAQHRSSASRGSPYVFHAALRKHHDCKIQHRIIYDGLDFESAMNAEEEFVDAFSLYPVGLNMIPGGFAGLRYLSTLGFQAKSISERDTAIERVANRENIDGKPNPLCAARWSSDQDYVNRVICGHSGRLTLEEVRQIRLLVSFGKSVDDVSSRTGAPLLKVKQVAAGKTYGRVA